MFVDDAVFLGSRDSFFDRYLLEFEKFVKFFVKTDQTKQR